jgi:hypothetical protein
MPLNEIQRSTLRGVLTDSVASVVKASGRTDLLQSCVVDADMKLADALRVLGQNAALYFALLPGGDQVAVAEGVCSAWQQVHRVIRGEQKVRAVVDFCGRLRGFVFKQS